MKKIFLFVLLGAWLPWCATIAAPLTYNNGILSDSFAAWLEEGDTQPESWDIAALRTVLHDSKLYKVLLTANITLPNMVKTGEYVMVLNELHQINHNLEAILQELQKMNEKGRYLIEN